MASNTPTAPSPSPLSFMNRLSTDIYHFRPDPTSTSTSKSTPTSTNTVPPPSLIIIASWMGARDAHIAKYIHPYRALYPTAEILLLRSELRHFMRPSAQVAALREFALPVVLAAIPPTEGGSSVSSSSAQRTTVTSIKTGNDSGDHPKLLIHLFSGGGSLTVFHLRKLFSSLSSSSSITPTSSSSSPNQTSENANTNTNRNQNQNREGKSGNENTKSGDRKKYGGHMSLPRHTITFDSAPPQFRYAKSYTAIASGIPSSLNPILRYLLLAPLIHAWCVFAWVQHFVTDREGGGPFGRVAVGHNDFAGIGTGIYGNGNGNGNKGGDGNEGGGGGGGEVRRTYIYSEADALVDWRDVESHAAAAVENGFRDVRLEKFEGSMHVAHARADEGRYWRVVRETWEGV